jgi:hypothetical protein
MWIDFSFSFSISNIMEVTEVDTNKGHRSSMIENHIYLDLIIVKNLKKMDYFYFYLYNFFIFIYI